jgi:hypothetical protein
LLLKFGQKGVIGTDSHLTCLLLPSPDVGHLKKKLILTRKDQNDQSEKSSEETAQRQTVWREGGAAVKVQVESLVPDHAKKKERKNQSQGELKKQVLCMCGFLVLKPSWAQTHSFGQGLIV